MEESDDFGDLYADLDCPPSSIPGLGQSAAGDGLKFDPNPVPTEKGMVDLEAGFSDYSDSDDDFNIVLNENECPGSLPLNMTAAAGEGDHEDEGGDFAVAMWGDLKNHDIEKGDERGTIARNGQHGSYDGSRLVGPSCSKASMSGRGDRDQFAIPYFAGSSSYNRDMSAAAQRGFCFSLPRNRTIFDINIEAFDQKPWKRHGVDLTDYFNFGMDEESWKSYTECLDNYRKQVTMPFKDPFYQSSLGELNSLVHENVEKGERGPDMPMGRAIQVEGSTRERIPSTDIRRPRNRDSDVVIQIAMGASERDVSILCNNSEHVDEGHTDASRKVSQKKPYERVSPCCGGKICKEVTNYSKHHYLMVNGSASREAICKIDCQKDEENPLRSDACMLEVGSSSGDQDPHASRSYDCGTHSQACKDEYSIDKESRRIQNAPLRSNDRIVNLTVSDHYHPDDSRSDIRTDKEASRVNSHEKNLSFGVHKHIRRTGLARVTQSDVDKDEELACNLIYRKRHNDVHMWDANSKMRKRKSSYGGDVIEHLPSYKEMEMSLTYKSRTYAEKHDSEKSYTKDSRKGDHCIHYERNFDEEYCSKQMESYYSERHHDDQDMRGFSCKGSDQSIIKQRPYFVENDSCLRLAEERRERIRMETEFDDSRSDCRYRERRVKFRRERYLPIYNAEKEIFDLKSGRRFYSSDRVTRTPVRSSSYDRSFDLSRSSRCDDIDVIDSRHLDRGLLVSHTVEAPCSADENGWHDAGSPSNGLPMSWKSSRGYINHRRPLDSRKFQIQSDKTICGYDPSFKGSPPSLHENGQGSDDDYNFEEKHIYSENIISSVQMSRHNRRLKPNYCTDDGVRFGCHEQDCSSYMKRSSLCKWSSSNENNHVDQLSIIDKHSLMKNARKKEMVKECFDARSHANFVSDKGRNEMAPVGCRETVNVHINSWNGKLARRCSTAGEKNDTSYRTDKLKDPRHPKRTHKHEDIQNISVSEGSRNGQASLKADNPKEAKLSKTDELSKSSLNKIILPQTAGDDEIEEGELIEESDKQEETVDTGHQICDKKVMKNSKLIDSSHNENNVGTYDDDHILKTLAKMEKRKERFKVPIAPKQGGPEKSVNSHADVSVTADEVKLQRPARKRRWGGN